MCVLHLFRYDDNHERCSLKLKKPSPAIYGTRLIENVRTISDTRPNFAGQFKFSDDLLAYQTIRFIQTGALPNRTYGGRCSAFGS